MSKEVKVGKIAIGNGNRITIQSMTTVSALRYDELKKQITDLKNAGCDIVRLAVNSVEEANICKKLISEVNCPLVADIQFDHRIAVACADVGFAKIRINPGNVGDESKVREVVSACKSNNIPIRIGVNSGSLDKNVAKKYGYESEALVASAIENVKLLEKNGFYDIVISAKSSDIRTTIDTYRKLSKLTDYPLHIGLTESGYSESGIIKSAIGIGSLLLDGIGDTIRVSLTGDPVNEVYAAKKILRSIGFDKNYCEIISCPTCSRCKFNLENIVKELSDYTKTVDKKIKIAAMGCVVNGPGEARDADFGFAGGENEAVIFENGKVVKKVKFDQIISEIKRRIDQF